MRIPSAYEITYADVDVNGAIHAAVTIRDTRTGKLVITQELPIDDEQARREFAQDAADKLREISGTVASDVNLLMADRALAIKNAAVPTAGESDPIAGPKMVRLSDVVSKLVEWLWEGRIALGKITLIVGDPGLGKSFLTLFITSIITTGNPWPDDVFGQHRPPGDVILMNAEDALDDTIRPRLDAAGADVNRVIALEGVKTINPETGQPQVLPFTLSVHLPMLRLALEQNPQARAVVIDPVSAYMGKTDSHSNAEVRGLLAPLAALASEFNVAMILVSHMNKSGGGKSVYRVNGSLAFPAAARAAWLVAKDEADEGRRLFLPVKNNLAENTGGLAFRLVDGRLEWEQGAVMIGADDVLSESERPTKCDEAETWLRDLLRAGSKPVKDIEADAKAAGFSIGTLRRAREALHIKPAKEGFGAGWTWRLPTDQGQGVQGAQQGAQVRPVSQMCAPSGVGAHLREKSPLNPHLINQFPPREAHSYEGAQRRSGRQVRDDPPPFDMEHLP